MAGAILASLADDIPTSSGVPIGRSAANRYAGKEIIIRNMKLIRVNERKPVSENDVFFMYHPPFSV
jgi:hypothetical protein